MVPTTDRKTYSYSEYRALTEQLVAEGRTTGPNQSEAMAHYTKMNHSRMKRLDKTIELSPELIESAQKLGDRYAITVITEAWCGDAAQNVPILAALTKHNPDLKLDLVMRDENLDLMDQYLTNGGRSIPKMLIYDKAAEKVVNTWGPRPAPVQQMVMDNKALPEDERPPYSEFVKEAQIWYNKDKTQSTQQELLAVLNTLA